MGVDTRFLRACCVLVCAGVLNACASAPLDLAFQREEVVAPVEAELRAASRELSEHVEAANWRLPDEQVSMGRFFDRLIRGGRGGDADDSTVERYLAEAGAQPAGRMAADLATIASLAADVSRSALAVASTGAALDGDALGRDIAAAESALGAARRARAFFVEARETGAASISAEGSAELDAAFVELDASITALATAADALAERRWAGESALIG